MTEAIKTTQYRVYETVRNSGGGMESLGTDWEYVEAETADAAAEIAAAERRDIEECEGIIMVATDDDGDSGSAEV